MQSVISAGFYWLWNEKVATEGRMGGWPERHQENKAQTMKPGAERPWSGSLFLPSIFISSIFFCELPPWFIKTNRTICACVPQTKNSLCLLPSVKALYWKHRADGAFALVILYVHSYNQLCSNSCFYLNKHVGVFILIYIDLVSICIVWHKNDSCFISHFKQFSCTYMENTKTQMSSESTDAQHEIIYSEQKCCQIHQITSLSQPQAALSDRK